MPAYSVVAHGLRVLKDLELSLTVFAAVFGLSTAWFTYKASYQTRVEQDELRKWYDNKWQTIKYSSWHGLPEITIRWLVEARDALAKQDRLYKYSMRAFLWTLPLLIGIPGWTRRAQLSVWFNIVGLEIHRHSLVVFTIVFVLVVLAFERVLWPSILIAFVVFSTFAVFALKVWLEILLAVPINFAPLVGLLLLPMLGILFISFLIFLIKWSKFELASSIFFGELVSQEPDSAEANTLLFGLSVASSFAITLLALFIGHRFDPQALVPQNMRVLLSNVLFDGATVVICLNVLSRAIERPDAGVPKKIMTVPTAIFLNIFVGFVLAMASLWIGVKQLNFMEVAHVSIARSVDGRHWDFGPYFCLMHTVFLPLLSYLTLVLALWCGKALVGYRESFYKRAAAPEMNGLAMTAALLGLFTALFTGGAAVLVVYEHVRGG